jgi:hypothetical protein
LILTFTKALTLVPIGIVIDFIGIKVQSLYPVERKKGHREGTVERKEVEQGRGRTEKCVEDRESEDSGVTVEMPTLILLIVSLSVVVLSTTAPVISLFGKSSRRFVVYMRREGEVAIMCRHRVRVV